MKKRVISILLVMVMAMGMLAGCKKEEKKVSGDRTLTIGVPQNINITDYYDNALTKYIQENLDITLEFMFFAPSGDEYAQQFSLMATGNEELPDILFGFSGFDSAAISEYGRGGYFLDLTDLIEDHAPNYKKAVSALPEDVQKRIKLEGTDQETGEFYGMPFYSYIDAPDYMQEMMFINQKWLDAVGMSAPTTTDELYAVLKAFATKDPNGNGIADEIPMMGAMGEGSNPTMWLINPFVRYNAADNYGYNLSNGKLWNPAVTDEYRQGLQFVNKLVSEKLYDELSFTMSTKDAMALISPEDNVARVGIWTGHPQVQTSEYTTILNEYVALNPLKPVTDKGAQGILKEYPLDFVSFITESCDNPELAMEFLDFWYLDDTVSRGRRGEAGVDWIEQEGTSLYGQKAHMKIVNNNAWAMGNSTWTTLGSSFSNDWNYEGIVEDSVDESTWLGQTVRLLGEQYEVKKTLEWPKEVVKNLIFTEEEKAEFDSAAWETYIGQSRDLFCTGEMDPNNDADWTEYLNTLEEYGESSLLKVAQKVYDRNNK